MAKTIYRNVRIFTGTGEIIEHAALVIEHRQREYEEPEEGRTPVKVAASISDRIVYLGPEEDCREEAEEIIDGEGATLMPGLVDAATRLDALHPQAEDHVDNIGIPYRTFVSFRNAAEALNAGVTTLRAEGMPNNIDIALKNSSAKALFFGPTVLATGPIYGVTGGKGHEKYGMLEGSGADALRGQMRVHISRGLEGVTLQVSGDPLPPLGGEYQKQMSEAEITALVKQAAGAEKPVTANASGTPSLRACLRAGVNAIKQGYRIEEEELEQMAKQQVAYLPCLVTSLGTEREREHRATVAAALAAGVPVIAATELLPSEPVEGTSAMVRELELLVEAGMTPAQALISATSEAARICRCKKGVLQVGASPDFLLVEGKPDEDITAMRRILAVVKDGRRAFCLVGGQTERAFHIHAPGYQVAGGTTVDWTEGALQGVREPFNLNTIWNLEKEQ